MQRALKTQLTRDQAPRMSRNRREAVAAPVVEAGFHLFLCILPFANPRRDGVLRICPATTAVSHRGCSTASFGSHRHGPGLRFNGEMLAARA